MGDHEVEQPAGVVVEGAGSARRCPSRSAVGVRGRVRRAARRSSPAPRRAGRAAAPCRARAEQGVRRARAAAAPRPRACRGARANVSTTSRTVGGFGVGEGVGAADRARRAPTAGPSRRRRSRAGTRETRTASASPTAGTTATAELAAQERRHEVGAVVLLGLAGRGSRRRRCPAGRWWPAGRRPSPCGPAARPRTWSTRSGCGTPGRRRGRPR